ncbi:L,D-transpeptidase family protein [Streptomyces longispororuber]|uniref:L,D-transpeptidase family protein n=1 Tax=Streptomyces longispororuber TaxID=68230 RepID=UPI00210A7069|nr:L,D-transpeptidase family protein [Streptomyces longispororuber]MCQ4213523.1 L,D-transpeptidase family protein [Streptomyces longispororuber]
MRTSVIRRTLAVAGALALAGGCTAQAVEGGGPPSAASSTAASPSPGKASPASPSPSAPADDAKPSASPTPTPAKVLYSPGDKGAKVRELQARLRQVAWLFDGPTGTYGASTTAAVKGFQGKRGLPRTGTTDTVTWQRLVRMTHQPTRDELYAAGGRPAAKPDPRCMTGRVLCISKTSRTLSWMVDGKRLLTTDVRFGSQYTPTREGLFHVDFKSRNHVSTIYHTPMPYAMFFSGGQAVHYSSDFAARGYAGASHGCVNVRDEAKIASLFAQVRTGDKVVVYW